MILDNYPLTKSYFLNWMMETYGVDKFNFDSAPWVEQCRAIARYLGYPVEFPAAWTNEYLENKIRDYLYLYESARLRYPYGIEDPVKAINEMDYNQREKLHPEMHKPADILRSLRDALVPLTKDYKMTVRPSLHDALIEMDRPVAPLVDEEAFWDQTIQDSWKKLVAPF